MVSQIKINKWQGSRERKYCWCDNDMIFQILCVLLKVTRCDVVQLANI